MSNEWDGRRRGSGEQDAGTGIRGASPGGSTPSSRRYAGVPAQPVPTGAEATVQRKTTANAWASLASPERGQPRSAFDPLDVAQFDDQPWRAQVAPTPIQRKQTLEPAADPVQDRSPMVGAASSPVQRSASMSAIDAPRADSVGEDRTTIDAAPAARGAAGADLDSSKAESLREDRATIAPDEASASGPLPPELAARAAARNATSATGHGIQPADIGTEAGPDSVHFAQAVAAFQAEHGLAVDGIVGPKTAAAVRGSAGPDAGATAADSSAPADAGTIDSRGTGSSLLQMKASPGAASDDGVHRAAAAGITGSSQPLPHLDRIQESFGHDLSDLKAHIGGPAATATAAMGADAYATGNDVAFGSAPDVHTAAHEAAHVLQQRAGVQLKGGVGQAGDSYEQHADAVADKTVRGESAAHLLPPASPSSPRPAVQQKKQSADKTQSASAGQTAGPIPTFAAPVFDLGERMVTTGPSAFLPLWIIRQPSETIPAPLSLTVRPKISGASMEPLAHAFAFRLGTQPAWMRQGETAVMATLQFEPQREGLHEAELVLRSGNHESQMTVRGTGVADGHLADSDATGGQSILAGGSERDDGQQRDGERGPEPGSDGPLAKADAYSYARRFATVMRDLYGLRVTQIALLKDEARTEQVLPLQTAQEASLLQEAAWLALDLVTARLSSLVQAAVEGGSATHRIIGGLINTGLAKGAALTKSNFKLVSDEGGSPVVFQAVAQKGSAESSDLTLAFFYSQMFALHDVQRRLTTVGEKELGRQLTGQPFAPEMLEAALDRLAARGEAIRRLQADTTLARWISFLSQRAVGSRAGKTDIAAPGLTSFDSELHVPLQPGAMLDIGVRGRRVVSARMAGTSETILSRLYQLDLIANRVPMRVFEAGLNSYAVLRDESGGLQIKGDVRRFARYRGPVEGLSDEQRQTEGARALVEDLVGGRTLAEHGVVAEDVD